MKINKQESEQIKQFAVDFVMTNMWQNDHMNLEKVKESIIGIYKSWQEAVPMVHICESYEAADMLFTVLTHLDKESERERIRFARGLPLVISRQLIAKLSTALGLGEETIKAPFSTFGGWSAYPWVAAYNGLLQVKDIQISNEKQFRQIEDFLRYGGIDMCALEEHAICVLAPIANTYQVDDPETWRLHCADGPAVVFRDGAEVYFWKDTLVEKALIMSPETLIQADLLRYTHNAELTRCAIEILGVSRFHEVAYDGAGLTKVDTDIDGQGYSMTLYSFEFEGETIKMLECTDPSTERQYNISVPDNTVTDVWRAKASTFEYQKIAYRHGDVGLLDINLDHDVPLIET